MVPVVACTNNLNSLDRSRAANPMLSLSSPAYQTSLCRAQPVNDVFCPYVFPTDSGFQFRPLLYGSKDLSVLRSTQHETKVTCAGDEKPRSLSGVTSNVRQQPLNPTCQLPINQNKVPCQKSPNQMNGSDDLRMTGSTNQRAEQLSWLAEVATGAVSSRVPNLAPSSPNHEKNCTATTPIHLNSESNPRSSLGTMILGSSPSNTRIYTPSFQSERLHLPSPSQHHHHQTSAVSASGLSLYYSQAPRNTPYPNYYPADYRPPLPYHSCINDGISQPRLSRPYFQSNAYSPITSIANVQLQSSHAQLPHSPGYLHSVTSSPMGFSLSPSSPHGRMSLSSTSVPSNRTIEEQISQEQKNSHLTLQAHGHRGSPQFHQEERRSYKSPEPGLASKSPSRDAARPLVYSSDSSKDFGRNPSPSHHCYKVPTGKEGSLKHRILRPPSINIVEPPHSVLDAPLSAPPIRTHGESSPKQLRQESYRSISTSSAFFLDSPQTHTLVHQDAPRLSPAFLVPSETTSLPTAVATPIPPTDCKAQNLKYPPAFMKGSIIQLANSQLKPVEQMTTEDFLECEALSSNLKIDSSTVITIEKMPSSGSAKLGFSVGQHKLQITVEAPLEHPFFVYKQGWSSCSPEGSLLRYGLTCHKLKVGDTCIFLTVKSDGKQSSKPPSFVPTNRISHPSVSVSFDVSKDETLHYVSSKSVNCSLSFNSTRESKAIKTDSRKTDPRKTDTKLLVPSFLQNSTSSTKIDVIAGPVTSGKRKRRWSAPEPGTPDERGSST